MSVGRRLPASIKRQIKRRLRIWYRFYCPVCDNFAHEFLAYGLVPRPNAVCPNCGTRERHRLAWLFLERKTDLFDARPKRMLHVAPQRTVARRLEEVPGLDYLTADLHDRKAMLPMDVTDIQFGDQTFDAIFCSHVLEHVSNDRQAMGELFRVLRTGGWAVLLVPITADVTLEDPAITDPWLRQWLFGQSDHVRRYGPDFQQRLEQAGFVVTPFHPADIVSEKEMARCGIPRDEAPVYFCQRSPAAPGSTEGWLSSPFSTDSANGRSDSSGPAETSAARPDQPRDNRIEIIGVNFRVDA